MMFNRRSISPAPITKNHAYACFNRHRELARIWEVDEDGNKLPTDQLTGINKYATGGLNFVSGAFCSRYFLLSNGDA